MSKVVCVIALHDNIQDVYPPAHRRSRIRVCMLFVKVMSIICSIFRRVRETGLVTRQAHAHSSR